jgi:hypothetical protein
LVSFKLALQRIKFRIVYLFSLALEEPAENVLKVAVEAGIERTKIGSDIRST